MEISIESEGKHAGDCLVGPAWPGFTEESPSMVSSPQQYIPIDDFAPMEVNHNFAPSTKVDHNLAPSSEVDHNLTPSNEVDHNLAPSTEQKQGEEDSNNLRTNPT